MWLRFFKILLAVFLAHLLVLGIVWVGFLAPLPRSHAVFVYDGTLASTQTVDKTEGVRKGGIMSESFILEKRISPIAEDGIGFRNL